MLPQPSSTQAVALLIPLALLAIGGLGAVAALGGEGTIEKVAESTGEATAAVVRGTYTAAKDGIQRNTTEFFMAITVLALAWGATQYARALLTRR